MTGYDRPSIGFELFKFGPKGDIQILRYHSNHALVIFGGSLRWNWGSSNASPRHPVVPDKIIRRLYQVDSAYEAQIAAITLHGEWQKKEFLVSDLARTDAYTIEGTTLDHHSVVGYGQKAWQKHFRSYATAKLETFKKERTKRLAKERRASLRAEAKSRGITIKELEYQKRCAAVSIKNEATTQRGLAELNRSMKTSDDLRDMMNVIQEMLSKLDNANPLDLRVRGEARFLKALKEAKSLSSRVTLLKSEAKKRKKK